MCWILKEEHELAYKDGRRGYWCGQRNTGWETMGWGSWWRGEGWHWWWEALMLDFILLVVRDHWRVLWEELLQPYCALKYSLSICGRAFCFLSCLFLFVLGNCMGALFSFHVSRKERSLGFMFLLPNNPGLSYGIGLVYKLSGKSSQRPSPTSI